MNDVDNKLISKIKKLLALAGNNPNQEEASQALLKAQQLMAENNIQVTFDPDSKETFAYGVEIANTKMNKGFRLKLSSIIAKNFRCQAIVFTDRPDAPIGFFGHADDAKVCKEAFLFAYNTAKRNGDLEYKRCRDLGLETKNVFNSYVIGFIQGICEALSAQCTALAIIVPPDVKTEFDSRFRTKVVNTTIKTNKEIGMDFNAFAKGKSDGKRHFRKGEIQA